LAAGSYPKGSGECRNDKGGDCGNGGLVSLNEKRGTANVAANRDLEAGWVLFGGAGFFVVWLSGYALLERWRKRSLHNYRNDKANNKDA
jgi:hypothetical protein